MAEDTNTSPKPKQFFLSQTDKKIAGVCGGLAEFFNVDSNLVRLGVVLLTLVTGGTVILAYIVMALIVPKRPDATIDKQ